MKRESRHRFSRAIGAASACSLLWVGCPPAAADAQHAGADVEPSAETRAAKRLEESVAHLLATLLTEFPTDDLLIGLVPELPYLLPPARAAALLEYAVDHNPNDPTLCRLMAELDFQRGEYEQALGYFERAKGRSQDTWEIDNRIAETLLALGRHQEVVDRLEANASKSTRPGETSYLLGQARTQLGDYTKARQHYENALRVNPQNAEWAYALGKLYLRLREPERARPYLELFASRQAARNAEALAAAKRRTQPEIHYASVPIAWERGEIAGILSNLCARGSALYRASGRDELAEQVLAQGREALEAAIEMAPEQPDAYRELARLYLRTAGRAAGETRATQAGNAGTPVRAAQLARRAVELEPSGENYLLLGRAYQAAADDRNAISALRRAAELEPKWLAPKNDLAWILATHTDDALRQPDEAVRLAEQAAALAQYRNPRVLNTLAAAYASAGQLAQARRVARNALSMARAAHNEALAADISRRLEEYAKLEPERGSD